MKRKGARACADGCYQPGAHDSAAGVRSNRSDGSKAAGR